MDLETETIEMDDWILRYRMPDDSRPVSVYLMIHGWTGDETVMWLFANRLPINFLKIAPRGLYPAQDGGFGWQARLTKGWPNVDDLQPPVEKIMSLLSRLGGLAEFSRVDFEQVHLLGFSQGAALAYTMGLLYPDKVQSIAGLAGFMPDGAGELVAREPLRGMPVFVTHGSQDEIVPVARARQAVELLERAGGNVTYCEDDVGHKLSATCFRALERFAARL
jgi:phospholipase/carboxylesterase